MIIDIVETVSVDGVEHVRVMMLLPATQAKGLMSADPTNPTGISPADARAVVMPVAAALREAQGGRRGPK